MRASWRKAEPQKTSSAGRKRACVRRFVVLLNRGARGRTESLPLLGLGPRHRVRSGARSRYLAEESPPSPR
eukprot:3305760-Alexandrium_andersonii.AAC.1